MNSSRVLLGLSRSASHLHFVDRGIAEKPVGEAAGVRHQLAHGHRMILILHDHVAVGFGRVDLQLGKFGNVLRHRIIELPLSLFEQHHHRDAGDRLAHGVDAEDAVLLHGCIGGDVAPAHGIEFDHFAVARNHGHRTCQAAGVHEFLHAGAQTRQALGRHACAFCAGRGQIMNGRHHGLNGESGQRRYGQKTREMHARTPF